MRLESQTGEPVRSPKNISDHIQIARMRRSQARVAELMMIKFGESGHPAERIHRFPSHESVVSRNAQKQRRWKIIDTLLCRLEIRLKLFFAQLFLLISSVSTEQSQTCVKSTVAVEQEQGDLLWQSNLTHLFAASKIIDNDTYTFN